MLKILMPLMFAASGVVAQDIRPGDVPAGRAALETRLIGQDIFFYDGGRAVFGENGRYAWEYGSGGAALGWYEIGDDSRICVRFDNGFERCDLMVVSRDRLVLITEKGERFPVHPSQ